MEGRSGTGNFWLGARGGTWLEKEEDGNDRID
jgi:hypothetical protein